MSDTAAQSFEELASLARELDNKVHAIIKDFYADFDNERHPSIELNIEQGETARQSLGPSWQADNSIQKGALSIHIQPREITPYLLVSGDYQWSNMNDVPSNSMEHPLQKLGSILKDQTGLTCEVEVFDVKIDNPLSTDGGPSMGIDTQA